MRLVIREYLSMLKETGELDSLLSDLVLAMGLNPLTRPKTGPRQYGVDLPAVGIDEDKSRKLFLITIKRGDITRNDWDTGKQAVRPSLNEILDSYLRTRVRPEHEKLTKKIILATGGELKQDVEPDWVNYINTNGGTHPKHGNIEFDFWGADKLALLIERYFLDEYLFPESAQKRVRKTIALADQNEYEPRYFYDLIEEILFDKKIPIGKSASSRRKRQKAFRLLNLSLNIVFYWCKEAENLKPSLLCAERTVLRSWDWMRQKKLFDCPITNKEYVHLFATYIKINRAYVIKLQPHCMIRDGLFGYGADELEYPLRSFELIGFMGVFGMAHCFLANASLEVEAQNNFSKEAQTIAMTLASLIKNNPATWTPRYDGHAIDIALGLLTLANTGYSTQAIEWLEKLSGRIIFAYQLGRHFPVSSDSYDELVAMEVGLAPPKEKLMDLSTILPMLADWYAYFDLVDSYESFQKAVTATFSKTDLQTWYPEDKTDEYLYRTNAGFQSGVTLTSIKLPETLSCLKERIVRIRKEREEFMKLSCFAQGWPILGLIASRHFRTPISPLYWQSDIAEAND